MELLALVNLQTLGSLALSDPSYIKDLYSQGL